MKIYLRFLIVALLLQFGLSRVEATTTLKISANSSTRQVSSEIEANYTTTHLFIDEVAGATIPITIFLDPGATGVESAEVFTNLNRRDRAALDANGDGVEDGILPPSGNTIPAGNDANYFKVYSMSLVPGGYQITLFANKTGAYRLTARFRFIGDSPGTYRYYGDTDGGGKRDHAIVVSPTFAREIRLYEVNTFNVEASGTTFSQRSTFEDLSDRPGAIHTSPSRSNQWNLDYVKALGVNWLWFQPYHPYAEEGRHLSAANINARAPGAGASTWLWNGGSPSEDVNYAYQLGSPYAVRNFWEIDPRMSATFSGNPSSQTDLNNPTNRANAMQAFRNFVTDADAAGVNIMPDAAFNHSGWDIEVGPAGIGAVKDGFTFDNRSWMAGQGASGWSAADRVHDRELRVFSRAGDYRHRASFYTDFFTNNIAPAPDRTDFGKWLDVCDIFFGRYAALVGAQDGSEANYYNGEGDWIDLTAPDWNGTSGGNFDAFTRATWRYFAQYAPYWLNQTRPAGSNRNSAPADGDAATRYAWDARGIDGLRCDFGQGLPPQCWEYIINVARSYKWSFVFMAETLDGGAPPYRSNRHFDILNENILFAVKGASVANDYRSMLESRRTAFGQGLVLLNTVSHDEDNYGNPWDAVLRYAALATNDGAPMLFPGQELGIATFFGYDLMEKNFGKYIPHFKTYNSMMPLWNNSDFGNDQLFPVYSGINAARAFSPALRSSSRWFMDGDGGNPKIFAVAKYAQANASPAFSDVVLAFANLDRSNDQQDNYKIPAALAPLLGLQDSRTYNVKNVAAYLRPPTITGRRDTFLWSPGITGANLKSTGFLVAMKKVPTTNGAWDTVPYEAQYLKVYDVTAPTGTPGNPAPPNAYFYSVGNSVMVSWASAAADSEGIVPCYKVSVTISGNTTSSIVCGTSTTINGMAGQTVTVTIQSVNPNDNSVTGPASSPTNIKFINPNGDDDGDGMTNGAEDAAGTNPFDPNSVFRVTSVSRPDASHVAVTWSSVSGKQYVVQSASAPGGTYGDVLGSSITAGGSSTSETISAAGPAFYRVRIGP